MCLFSRTTSRMHRISSFECPSRFVLRFGTPVLQSLILCCIPESWKFHHLCQSLSITTPVWSRFMYRTVFLLGKRRWWWCCCHGVAMDQLDSCCAASLQHGSFELVDLFIGWRRITGVLNVQKILTGVQVWSLCWCLLIIGHFWSPLTAFRTKW